MKNISFNKITFCLIILFGITQMAHAGKKVDKKIVYEGDTSAKSICVAIAKNQVNRLNRALKNQKFTRLDNSVHERFTCNGKDLLSFAQEMNSPLAANYLAPKFDQQSGASAVASIEK